MSYFNDIISENEYFMDLPDCIAEGIDYKGKIEQAFGLTDGMLNLGNFACERREGHFEYALTVNDKPVNFSIQIMSDYVDGRGLIAGLNHMLKESGYMGDRYFSDITGEVADFGIAFITREQEDQLAENGLIYRQWIIEKTNSEIHNVAEKSPEEKAEDRKQLIEMVERWRSEADDPIYKELHDLLKSGEV